MFFRVSPISLNESIASSNEGSGAESTDSDDDKLNDFESVKSDVDDNLQDFDSSFGSIRPRPVKRTTVTGYNKHNDSGSVKSDVDNNLQDCASSFGSIRPIPVKRTTVTGDNKHNDSGSVTSNEEDSLQDFASSHGSIRPLKRTTYFNKKNRKLAWDNENNSHSSCEDKRDRQCMVPFSNNNNHKAELDMGNDIKLSTLWNYGEALRRFTTIKWNMQDRNMNSFKNLFNNDKKFSTDIFKIISRENLEGREHNTSNIFIVSQAMTESSIFKVPVYGNNVLANLSTNFYVAYSI